MDKNKVRKEILELMDSIRAHSDEIKETERLPQIELELILAKIRKLYEKSVVYNYLNTTEEGIPEVTPEKTVNKTQEPAASEPVNAPEEIIQEKSPVPPLSEKPSIAGKPLSSFIGLNERIRFTNILFSANAADYNLALQRIDSSSNPEEAWETISGMRKNWEEEDQEVKNFKALIHKKFIS